MSVQSMGRMRMAEQSPPARIPLAIHIPMDPTGIPVEKRRGCGRPDKPSRSALPATSIAPADARGSAPFRHSPDVSCRRVNTAPAVTVLTTSSCMAPSISASVRRMRRELYLSTPSLAIRFDTHCAYECESPKRSVPSLPGRPWQSLLTLLGNRSALLTRVRGLPTLAMDPTWH